MNYYCVAVSMNKVLSNETHIKTVLDVIKANNEDEARGIIVKEALKEFPDYKIGHTVERKIFYEENNQTAA